MTIDEVMALVEEYSNASYAFEEAGPRTVNKCGDDLARARSALRAALESLIAAPAEPVQQAEPVAWRDHVEQRLRAWKQPHINRSGDQMALDDFMGADDIDNLIDYVCDEWSDPPPAAPARQAEPVAWRHDHGEDAGGFEYYEAASCPDCQPLFLHPPAAEVQRLVDALTEIADTSWAPLRLRQIARAALEGVKP